MKPNVTLMRLFVVLALAIVGAMAWAANTKQTVSQVSSSVSLTTNVDYVISSATPFTGNGVVNIQNIDHAVLILSAVKPSVAISQWLSYVKINGATAVNGENCQVKIYNRGCIILPYGDSTKPLTVYAGQNFSGESCNDFGLEDTGGFMNTLTDAKLNNRIRSFKLKRGYMVTFSLRTGGYGYSRCFIAADQDLEVASLPDIMDQKISSYRVFKWYDASKKGLANDNGKEINNALNTTSSYDFSGGWDMSPDVECVPHHIYEDWPSASACGAVTYSPHLKTNNEPGNPSDDHPQTVQQILDNWENLMATGMRLCSPSSHDGSLDYMRNFLDSIDNRGWRCDIIDLHCYWKEWNLKNMVKGWHDSYGNRPIWISEWVWGSSWNNEGIFQEASSRDNPSAADLQKNKDVVQNVCEVWNNADYIERYYYWNSERNCSKIYRDGNLTPAGEYYATMNPGLAYKGTSYVPTPTQQKDPSDLKAITVAGKIKLQWKDYNGELNRSMTLEYRANSSSSWQQVMSIQPSEESNKYTHTCEATQGAGEYRIHLVDYNGEHRYSNVISLADTQVYYLYNVAARQWLCSGNGWGTHASLTSNGGVDIRIEEVASGKYTIDTQFENGDQHYLNILDNGPWTDQTPGQWTFTEKGDGSYMLSCNGKNLVYDGSTTSLIASDDTGVNARWLFQTRDDRMAMLATATSKNPIDASFLISDNDFARYNKVRRGVWNDNPSVDGYFAWNEGNQVAEKYNCNFDVYQTITGAPAGNYQLKVQGFYRNGNIATSASRHNNGDEQLNALLYVNSHTKALPSIYTEAGKLTSKPEVGATANGINGRFPNDRAQAAQFFLAGLYENQIDFTLTEGEDLRLGIKKSVATGEDWACFDNFRLIYLGNDDVAKTTTKTAAGHNWSTFYSGVANYRLPEGATAYAATVCDGALHLHELGRVIPKECAVIIVSNSEGLLMMERTDETVDAVSENDLRGADTETLTSNYNGTVYVMGASTAADFGFHRYTGYELPAGKAFLVLGTGQSRPLTIRFDGAVTAVDGIGRPTTDGKVYNLQGLRVTSPRKGLYVKDGNKVVVK